MKGLIWGLKSDLGSEKPDLETERSDLGSERPGLGTQSPGRPGLRLWVRKGEGTDTGNRKDR